MVFYQLLERVEWLHFNKLIHLDIKPNNIVIGRNSASNILHMIDFGLTQPYIVRESGEHIDERFIKSFVGTCRYASINAHKGM